MSALGDFPGGPVLLMQRVQVPSLVEKLSSYKLHGQKKKKKEKSQLSGRIQSALYILSFHRFDQQRIENIHVKNNPKSSRKQNFCCIRNYLHSIYIIFTIIYIAFTPY